MIFDSSRLRVEAPIFREGMGSCTSGKLQRILASQLFSQHAKLNMAGFVLYLLGDFGLRCRMVELHPKTKKMSSPAGKNGKVGSAMDRKEALSNRHSAVSRNQDQDQKQQQRRDFGTTGGPESTEKGKTTPEQRAEALVRRIGEA